VFGKVAHSKSAYNDCAIKSKTSLNLPYAMHEKREPNSAGLITYPEFVVLFVIKCYNLFIISNEYTVVLVINII
jgi:hypothetical protein